MYQDWCEVWVCVKNMASNFSFALEFGNALPLIVLRLQTAGAALGVRSRWANTELREVQFLTDSSASEFP